MRTIVHDLFANTETIEAMTDEALDALKHGEVQQARHVLALLASEIVIAVTNIPLASYPAAVKSVVPLIDQGKIEEAKPRCRQRSARWSRRAACIRCPPCAPGCS